MQPGTIGASELEQEHLRELESQTPPFNTSAGDGTESRGATERCLRVQVERRLIIQIKKQIEQLDRLIRNHIQNRLSCRPSSQN